jgi:ribosome-binding factor A
MSRRRSSDKENRAPGQRQLRVGEELRHILADPERNATAFVMPLGGQEEPRLLAALRRAAPWFRARVGERAGLRHAPEIRFETDRTFDEADRIGALLRRPDVARDIKND